MAKTVNVEIRPPEQSRKRLEEVAKLAGVSLQSVIRVLLALHVMEAGKP